MVTRIKKDLFSHFLTLPVSYFDKHPVGELMARTESDTERVRDLFSSVGITLATNLLFFLGMLVVCFALSPKVTAYIACALPFALGFVIFFFDRLRVFYDRSRSFVASINARITEFVQGIAAVSASGRYGDIRVAAGIVGTADLRLGDRVAPVLDAQSKDLIGVVQIINSKAGQPFPPMIEEGATHVCETLAIAYKQRQKPTLAIKGKYDNLVTNAVISAEELDLATRSSRRKNLDIETVLIDEFQVKVQAIGEALAAYFGVSYEPFKSDRVKPMDLLKNMSREFIETSMWVPIDETQADGIIVLTTDPEKIRVQGHRCGQGRGFGVVEAREFRRDAAQETVTRVRKGGSQGMD